jgi:hypothetical protein
MSELELFKGNSLVNSELFKSLQDTANNLAGGSGGGSGMRRISLRGGRFRELVNGEQVNVNNSGSLNVVILDAAKISRAYYAGTYDPENPSGPTCWSADTQRPSPDVPDGQRQASACKDCPMNVRGSGQGETRACRYSQRMAVALEGQYDKIYQVNLAAMSVFGQAKDGKMPMQAYANYLKAHNAPPSAVVTEMYFDDNSDVPKLYFKAARPLEEDELQRVIELREHPDVERAITFTVSQADGVQEKPSAPKKSNNVLEKKAAPEVADDAPVEEPKNRGKKKEEAASNEDLSDLVDAWDDE